MKALFLLLSFSVYASQLSLFFGNKPVAGYAKEVNDIILGIDDINLEKKVPIDKICNNVPVLFQAF